jgi:predicted Fe-Mo cluster-binding NifX family protein
MKVAISATGNTLENKMDQRFGRAAHFIIVNTETMEFEALDNSAAASAGGAGITSSQTVIDKGVEAVITGNVGPNAMSVLNAAEVSIFQGGPVSVQENIEKLKRGELKAVETSVPQHFGMGFKGGQG